jgi:hypothetical protein
VPSGNLVSVAVVFVTEVTHKLLPERLLHALPTVLVLPFGLLPFLDGGL